LPLSFQGIIWFETVASEAQPLLSHNFMQKRDRNHTFTRNYVILADAGQLLGCGVEGTVGNLRHANVAIPDL